MEENCLLQCCALDVGTDHPGRDRGRSVLGVRSRGNGSSLAGDQDAARSGSGHAYGLRIVDVVFGRRIHLVAAHTIAKRVPYQPGHSHRRSGFGTAGAERDYCHDYPIPFICAKATDEILKNHPRLL